jgi:hypothetical protein
MNMLSLPRAPAWEKKHLLLRGMKDVAWPRSKPLPHNGSRLLPLAYPGSAGADS